MASQTRSVCNTISSGWADPDNAFAEDALCTSTKVGGKQNIYNFVGNPFTIPGGSVIDGVAVKVVRGGDADDYYTIELQDADPAWRLKTGTPYQGSCASGLDEILGGPADKWGGNFTQIHINSASFQVRLTYTRVGKGNLLFVDHIEVTIQFSVSAPVEKNADDIGGGSDSFLKEREASVVTFGDGSVASLKERETAIATSGSGMVLLLPLKERGLSDVGVGSEALFKLAEKSILDIATGLVASLKERFITTSESAYGFDEATYAAIFGKEIDDIGGGLASVDKETGAKEKKRRRWPWHYRSSK